VVLKVLVGGVVPVVDAPEESGLVGLVVVGWHSVVSSRRMNHWSRCLEVILELAVMPVVPLEV